MTATDVPVTRDATGATLRIGDVEVRLDPGQADELAAWCWAVQDPANAGPSREWQSGGLSVRIRRWRTRDLVTAVVRDSRGAYVADIDIDPAAIRAALTVETS